MSFKALHTNIRLLSLANAATTQPNTILLQSDCVLVQLHDMWKLKQALHLHSTNWSAIVDYFPTSFVVKLLWLTYIEAQ